MITRLEHGGQVNNPRFVMTDLDIGMNHRLCEPLEWDDSRLYDRGKVMTADELESGKDFGRYLDVDGDGIPYRTLPGTDNAYAAFFTRGSGHNEKGLYSEKPQDYVGNMDRLKRKFETARKMMPKAAFEERPGATTGLLCFGSSHYGTTEARDKLSQSFGIEMDYCRLRALPPGPEVRDFIERHDRVYVVEQNRDAQLMTIFRDEYPELSTKLVSIRQYNGLPLDATTVIDGVINTDAPARAGKAAAPVLSDPSTDLGHS